MDDATPRCETCGAKKRAFEHHDPETRTVVDTQLECPNAGYCDQYAGTGR